MTSRGSAWPPAAGRGSFLGVLLALGSACAETPAGAPEVTVARALVGDTTVVTSRTEAEPVPVPVDSIEVLWRDSAVENPLTLAALGDDRVVVADRQRIHVISRGGRHLRSFGRTGEGPGEFGAPGLLARSPTSIGVVGDSLILAFDNVLSRLTWFDTLGVVRATRRFEHYPLFRIVHAPRLFPDAESFLYVAHFNGVRESGEPDRGGVFRYAFEVDSAALVVEFTGSTYEVSDGTSGPIAVVSDLFGPELRAAVGPDGRFAHGDGVEYCLDVERMDAPSPARYCRTRPRLPAPSSLTDPDLGALTAEYGADASRVERMRPFVEAARHGEHLPSLDSLVFGDEGDLWVRVYDEYRLHHPYLFAAIAELVPEYYRWDRFDEEGVYRESVRFPRTFRPSVFLSREALGVIELPTGELAIARARW